jgi:hypothetical protein
MRMSVRSSCNNRTWLRFATPRSAALIDRFVDAELAATEVAAVEFLDRLARRIIVELDETEATRAAGFPVGDYACGMNGTHRGEEGFELPIVNAPGEITHIQFFHTVRSLLFSLLQPVSIANPLAAASNRFGNSAPTLLR